jgi:UTP-glucose-1-phosphate uridylyltransferase
MVLSQRPCLQQMVDAYPNIGSGSLIATTEVSKEKTSLYGILNPESRNGNLIKATGMVEKPNPEDAPSNYAVIGRYILEPSIFEYLDKKVAGAGGEIQLTDAIVYASQSAPLHGFLYEGQRYDCGNRLGFIEANLAFALARPDMQEKVTKLIQSYLVRNAA